MAIVDQEVSRARKSALRDIIARYNDIVTTCETDPGLRIEAN